MAERQPYPFRLEWKPLGVLVAPMLFIVYSDWRKGKAHPYLLGSDYLVRDGYTNEIIPRHSGEEVVRGLTTGEMSALIQGKDPWVRAEEEEG